MFWNQIKTAILLGSLSGLLLLLGHWFGGRSGLAVTLFIAILMNFIAYFYSDKIVLKMYGALPLDKTKYGFVYEMVEELCQNAKMPVPKLWYIPNNMANAFATGRNPKNASVPIVIPERRAVKFTPGKKMKGLIEHGTSGAAAGQQVFG